MNLSAGLRQRRNRAVMMGIITLAAFIAVACGGSAATPAVGKSPEAQSTVAPGQGADLELLGQGVLHQAEHGIQELLGEHHE